MREIEFLWLFAACFPFGSFMAIVWYVDWVDTKNRKRESKTDE